MLEEAKIRTFALQARMRDKGIRRAVFTDESSIAYLAGFWGYLGIEFGRPTMLVVDTESAPIVITPLMESEMVGVMTWIEDVRVWEEMHRGDPANMLRTSCKASAVSCRWMNMPVTTACSNAPNWVCNWRIARPMPAENCLRSPATAPLRLPKRA